MTFMRKAIEFLGTISFVPLSFYLAGCGAISKKSVASSVNKPLVLPASNSGRPKIIAFGDSLTAGFGLTENESYPYLLQQKLKADGYDYEVVNAGISGDTSQGGLE